MSRVLACLTLAVAAVGCGGGGEGRVETVTAKGTLSVDGSPHGPAKLVFTPVGDPPNRPTSGAQVGADGSFAVSTYADGDGAAPGKYTVTISTTDSMTDPAMMGKAQEAIVTEPSEVEVPAGGTSDLKVDLKSKAGAKPRKGGPARPLGT